MTDAEVVCTWMEPKPEPKGISVISYWWEVRTICTGTGSGGHFGTYGVFNKTLTDDHIRRIEDALSPFQLVQYGNQFPIDRLACLRATPERKIAALAAVLRPLVEKPAADVCSVCRQPTNGQWHKHASE